MLPCSNALFNVSQSRSCNHVVQIPHMALIISAVSILIGTHHLYLCSSKGKKKWRWKVEGGVMQGSSS